MSTIASTALLAGLLVAGPNPSPRYSPLAVHDLILRADLIVEGVVTEVGPEGDADSAFTIRVLDVIAGEWDGKSLELAQFEDWVCAPSRYDDYKAGQRALFHIRHLRTKTGAIDRKRAPRVLGGGNDGECPADKDSVYVRESGFPNAEPATVKIGDSAYRGYPLPKQEYAKAARGLRDFYTWESHRSGGFPEIRAQGSESDIQAYGQTSPLAAALVRKIDESASTWAIPAERLRPLPQSR